MKIPQGQNLLSCFKASKLKGIDVVKKVWIQKLKLLNGISMRSNPSRSPRSNKGDGNHGYTNPEKISPNDLHWIRIHYS
jgi:hypothetical protein